MSLLCGEAVFTPSPTTLCSRRVVNTLSTCVCFYYIAIFFELRRQRATFACRRNSASGRRQRLTRGLGRSPSLGSGAGSPSGVRGRAPRRKFCIFSAKNRPKIGCELLPKSPQTRAQCIQISYNSTHTHTHTHTHDSYSCSVYRSLPSLTLRHGRWLGCWLALCGPLGCRLGPPPCPRRCWRMQ